MPLTVMRILWQTEVVAAVVVQPFSHIEHREVHNEDEHTRRIPERRPQLKRSDNRELGPRAVVAVCCLGDEAGGIAREHFGRGAQ